MYSTVDTEFGRMGIVICYGMDFTDTARRLAQRGRRLLRCPRRRATDCRQALHALFLSRAGDGAAVVKSAYSGDSAIVDGFERIAGSPLTPDGSAAVLVADAPRRSGMPRAALLG